MRERHARRCHHNLTAQQTENAEQRAENRSPRSSPSHLLQGALHLFVRPQTVQEERGSFAGLGKVTAEGT